MAKNDPKFRREPTERKEALILATLSLIAEQGVRGATVREIAKRAQVTQGLIRHYFSSKEELILASYEYHMSQMTALTSVLSDQANFSCMDRLRNFVMHSLSPPVVDPRSVSLWAGFLNKTYSDPRMHVIHKKTYCEFRDRLETLISCALAEADIPIDSQQLRGLSIACNAVIDGLWMEGGALEEAFETGELSTIGLRSVSAIIGLDLMGSKGDHE